MRRIVFAWCFTVLFATSAFAFWPFGGGTTVSLSVGEPLAYEKADKKIFLRYKLLDQEDTAAGGRRRSNIRIQCARELGETDDDTLKEIVKALKEDLFARTKVLSVFVHFPPRFDGMGDIVVHYAEDKKGFSGEQDWEWEIQRQHTEELDIIGEMEEAEAATPAPDEADIKKARGRALALYKELLGFKDSKAFLQKGFESSNPKAQEWLKNAKALRDELKDTEYPFMLRIAPGTILQLGIEYLNTGGKDNDATKMYRKELEEELAQ